MGKLVAGRWTEDGVVTTGATGEFVRDEASFRDRITADGSSGFAAEADRYHLYVAHACPWAHRVMIVRALRGLEGAIPVSIVDPILSSGGWEFTDRPRCTRDTALGKRYLREVYLEADPRYSGRVTVPVLWDRKRRTIVNNESRELIRMFDTELDSLATSSIDLAPIDMRDQIDRWIDAIYQPINNGVYRCGFARTQQAHEAAVLQLFAKLDELEAVLARQRFLSGARLTEADICLFVTLWRFDLVYHGHFKCNLRRIVDYPALSAFVRDVYQTPGVSQTCDIELTKAHYYGSHRSLNPSGIVPLGPVMDFAAPHDRERLG